MSRLRPWPDAATFEANAAGRLTPEQPSVVTPVDLSEDRWRVAIGAGPAFEVNTEVARAFLAPGRYTVYYLPGGKGSRCRPNPSLPQREVRGTYCAGGDHS